MSDELVPSTVDERLICLVVNRPGGAREVFRRLKDSSQMDGIVNQQVLEACRHVYARSNPKPMILSVDMIRGELQAMGIYNRLDQDYLKRCFESKVGARELDSVLEIIKRRKAAHEIDKAITELTKVGDSDPTKRIEIASRIAELSQERTDTYQNRFLSTEEWEVEIDRIEKMPESVPSGFPLLDRKLGGGLTTGGYHLIASPTGSGKTILMITMWKHMLDMGVPAVYINYEIAREVFMKFLFAQFTGVNVMRSDVDPEILEDAKSDFRKVVRDLHERNLLFLSDPMQGTSADWNDASSMIRTMVEDYKAKVIFFDTINSVTVNTRKGQDSRWNEYEKIALDSEHLNQELGTATVFSVQMDKEAQKSKDRSKDKNEDKTPGLQDVAGSKTLTEKAVSVIHLHRSDIYDKTGRIDYSELHVTKNRLMGQEMGNRPIRVGYDFQHKRYYELPADRQVAERIAMTRNAEVFITPKAATGVTKHPTLGPDKKFNEGEDL